MKQKLKVAVIGVGNIGTTVATNLVKGNRAVIVADRTEEKANALAEKLGVQATPMKIADAIKAADIIVFAVWFSAIMELIKQYAHELEGKTLIDPSNPIAPDDKGGFKKIIDERQSAGEIIAAIAPAKTKLVKAFGTLSAGSLASAAFQKPEAAVLFYATDDADITMNVEELIRDSGFAPLYIGGISRSIKIEVFGDLHEFGALGKTTTLSEIVNKG